MRYIEKLLPPPPELVEEHKKPPETKEEAAARWKAFYSPERRRVLNFLLDEQFHLCCYSELRADHLGLGYHIEHVQPKSEYPQRTFDYHNLAASALKSDPDLKTFKQNNEQIFAGHAKDDQYDASLFISSLQAGCSDYFFYINGSIEPSPKLNLEQRKQAEHTIETLKLNCPYLLNLRKRKHQELQELFDAAIELQDFTKLRHEAQAALLPNGGKLEAFFSLTRQFFGPIAEQVLQQHAPNLV